MQKTQAKFLVVDTSAFIETISLHNIGEKVITIPEVIDEIRNKRQFRRLFSLTDNVEIRNAFSESIALVSEFSKKTGDYASLSATDIKLIALTYEIEVENIGSGHLKKEPIIKGQNSNINVKIKNHTSNVVNGLNLPVKIEKYNDRLGHYGNGRVTNSDNKTEIHEMNENLKKQMSSDSEYFSSDEEVYETACEEIFSLSNRDEKQEIENEEQAAEDGDEPRNECSQEDESETVEDGWISSSNLLELKRVANGSLVEDATVVVGCLTTDFAIQNVLMQIGLNVITLDGKLIKQLRTYILRCYACFKTTTNMKKEFCPNCGNKTLKRVSVYLDKDGNKCMYINFKKPISTRGKRFSLPIPQGGKHAVNPRLVQDARRPHQKQTKLARTKTDPLLEDYTAGWSPFVMRDVHSRSAQLGFNKGKPVYKYWMKKNPNESKRMPRK